MSLSKILVALACTTAETSQTAPAIAMVRDKGGVNFATGAAYGSQRDAVDRE